MPDPRNGTGLPAAPGARRPIRSYVLRGGRLTRGQQRAFDTLWPRYGIEFSGRPLDLREQFETPGAVYLEIGFGNGEALAHLAAAHPGNNYLGVEVHPPGVGHLLLQIQQRGLRNVRVIRHDAVEVLQRGIGDRSLAGVFLFFPDPWHKKRHHKRRILQPGLVAELARVIQSGGILHIATDWEEYARYMMEVISDSAGRFENTAGAGRFAPRPAHRPQTRFEQRGRRLGHGVRELLFRRC